MSEANPTGYTAAKPKIGTTSPKCPICGKSVYHAEKITALNKDWHKMCFKCKTCGKLLETGQYGDRDGDPYCKRCYAANFKPAGFGFGALGGYTGVGAGGTGTVENKEQFSGTGK